MLLIHLIEIHNSARSRDALEGDRQLALICVLGSILSVKDPEIILYHFLMGWDMNIGWRRVGEYLHW
jgi:hypothetical protein